MPPSRIERILLLAALFTALAWVAADACLLHQGFGAGDETEVVTRVESALEGGGLGLRPGGGCITVALLAVSSRLLGRSLPALLVPGLVALLLETFLLVAWVRRRHGEQAALWAAIVNLLCAFSLLRWRHFLSYAFLPVELLACLAVLPWARKGWAAVWGAAVCLFLFDYEAWVFALPILTAAWFREHPGERKWPLAAGLVAGLALVLLVPKDFWASYLAVRGAQSTGGAWGFLQGLGQMLSVFKGSAVPFPTAFVGTPSFPIFFLPALVAGLVLAGLPSRRLEIAAAAFGLLPLFARSSAFEAHRAVVAWPFLCAVAGIGFAAILGAAGRWRRWAAPALAVLAAVGCAAFETAAYSRGIGLLQATTHARSREILRASAELRALGWKGTLLDSLGPSSDKSLAYFMGGPGVVAQAGATVALVPCGYVRSLDRSWGTWHVYSESDSPPVLVLFPRQDIEGRLALINRELGALWSGLPQGRPLLSRAALLAYLDGHPDLDPWVETACWEAVFKDSFLAGKIDLALFERAFRRPLVSAGIYALTAFHAADADPAYALPLLRAALAKDSHREQAWRLYFNVLHRLGYQEEERHASALLQSLPASSLWAGAY